jgi:hypothetical protein
MQFVVRSEVFNVGAVFHGVSQNGVTVVVVQYKEIFVALTGCYGKSSGEIGGDLAVTLMVTAKTWCVLML